MREGVEGDGPTVAASNGIRMSDSCTNLSLSKATVVVLSLGKLELSALGFLSFSLPHTTSEVYCQAAQTNAVVVNAFIKDGRQQTNSEKLSLIVVKDKQMLRQFTNNWNCWKKNMETNQIKNNKHEHRYDLVCQMNNRVEQILEYTISIADTLNESFMCA